jgi:hypothetical protein
VAGLSAFSLPNHATAVSHAGDTTAVSLPTPGLAGLRR